MSDRINIADYLLGELSGEDLVAAERRMREDPGFRAEVERLRPAVQRLEDLPREAWEGPEPPPLSIPASPSGQPAPRERREWWRRPLSLRPASAVLASAVLVLLGVGAGQLIGGGDSEAPDTAGRTLALEPIEPRGAGASGSAELIGTSGGEAVVDVSGVSPNEAGEFYELWLLTSPDDLVSLGSFKVGASGRATVRVPLPVDPAEFEFIDLSIERDDGDASHSGRSVLRAPT